MQTIVAGRFVTSENEYIEAALGFDSDLDALLDADPELQADFLEFLQDTSDLSSDIDRENLAHLRRQLGVRPQATVVPMPRRGTAHLTVRKGVEAA